MTGRRSPQLVRLPRREGGRAAEAVVKLRTTTHRGGGRATPESFTQLTVPAHIADTLPPDVRFAVSFDGRTLHYRRLDL